MNHRAGDAPHRTRRVPTIWWNPCATLGGKHPSFTSCFHDEQPLGQCEELPTRVAVLWCPILGRTPLEGKCQYWRIALVETAQLFRILRDQDHESMRFIQWTKQSAKE